MSRCPVELELLLFRGAIPQIQVDQILVWDAALLRQAFEVLDSVRVEPNRNLPFGLAQIRIGHGLGKIIALPHGSHLA